MHRILLINPNSSAATTAMMVAIAQAAAARACHVAGATATRAPPMIVEPDALTAAADEVVEIATLNDGNYDGFIIAAFGDPGLSRIRMECRTPVAGIAEAALKEAAAGEQAFGIATTTPALQTMIDRNVAASGLAAQYTGLRLTAGNPTELVKHPGRLRDALADAVRRCVNDDGAQAVIIGGGPLGEAARELQPMFPQPIIQPIPAATRLILGGLRP